jgi:hypothetical protein
MNVYKVSNIWFAWEFKLCPQIELTMCNSSCRGLGWCRLAIELDENINNKCCAIKVDIVKWTHIFLLVINNWQWRNQGRVF